MEPLSTEARDHLMAEHVGPLYSKFVAAVARHRGVTPGEVRHGYGGGRVVNADSALKLGMVDKLVSFEGLMHKLTGGAGNGQAARQVSVEMLRLRQEHRKRLTAG